MNSFDLAVAFQNRDDIVLAVRYSDELQIWRTENDSNGLIHSSTSHIQVPARSVVLIGTAVAIFRDASLVCCLESLNESDNASITVLNLKTGAVLCIHDCNIAGLIKFSGSDLMYEGKADSSHTDIRVLRSHNVETGETSRICDLRDYAWMPFGLSHAKDRLASSRHSTSTVYMEALSHIQRHGDMSEKPRRQHLIRLATTPKGDSVVIVRENRLEILDTRGLVQKIFPLDIDINVGDICGLSISPDSKHVALGLAEETVVWNVETDSCLRYHGMKCLLLQCFSNDSRSMACEDRSDINLWSLEPEQKLLLQTRKPRDRFLRYLRFSPDGEALITDRGRLHVASATWTSERTPVTDKKEVTLAGSQPSGPWPEEWIRFDDEDLLWIPEEYRSWPTCCDAQGGTVALGQKDGSVMILVFSDPSGKYEVAGQ